ncbi:M56 family metallopeptidase [Tersicoccus sp. MR15.9]|uniref:M56 family metallopeptidase n=1 Tax=Tersicoccus mangrovi TaxID=3121635 RepID=UPI002FE6947F
MVRTGLILGLLALLLAWPVPMILVRARWTARSPALALVLWQAIALSGGMCMIGALLAFGLAPAGHDLLSASSSVLDAVDHGIDLSTTLGVVSVFALCAAVLLGGHLLLTLALTWRRISQRRRAHRDALRLLGRPAKQDDTGYGAVRDGAVQDNTLVVEHPTPLAYCLPGGTKSVTVLSDGLLQALAPAELDAVLAHEHAHLTQHHHLLLLAFAAWRSSLPWLPTSRLALGAVTDLVEMLADDDALHTVDRTTLVRAIAIVGGASGSTGSRATGATAGTQAERVASVDPVVRVDGVEADAMATPRRVTPARVTRLLRPPAPLGSLPRVVVGLISLVLVLAPAALLA